MKKTIRFECSIDYPVARMRQNRLRLEARNRFECADRVPVGFCLVPRFFAPLFQLPYKEYFRDVATHYHWQLEFAKYRIERIPEDTSCTGPVLTVYPFFDNVLDSDALGAEVVWPENETLQACPTIHTVEAMERFTIPPPDAGLWGRLVDWCRQMRGLAARTRLRFGKVEGRVQVGAPTIGCLSPHMLAIDLVGQDFYWWQIEYPAACHRFLEKIMQALLQAQAHFERVWPRPRYGGWLAEDSAQVMSLDSFRRFCVPYASRLFAAMGGANGERMLHMCGKSDHLFPALVEDLHITEFSLFGYLVSPVTVARALGGKMRLWGNLNPMNLLSGTPATVRAEAQACLEALAPCGGLVLGDGANVCPGTPLANLAAVTEAAEAYGRPPRSGRAGKCNRVPRRSLTGKERMLIAMRNGQPDRVPCAPDISIMVPARLTGKPFWEIEYYGNPPLWKSYVDAAKYFGIDLWSIWGWVNPHCRSEVTRTQRIVRKTRERMVVRTLHRTPAGDMESEMTYLVADSATPTEKPVKDLARDFAKLRYFYPALTGYDANEFEKMRIEVGGAGVAGMCVGYPGFQQWYGQVQGGLETLTFAYYDRPDLIEEWRAIEHAHCLRIMEYTIDARPDFILLGGSGSITLQSPAIFRQLCLPTIQAQTRMAKQAGIPTMLHCCGKERALVAICAAETDLDCVNPVEPPPQGDCDLAELKRTFGRRMAFMGNLHTTDVMLRGSVAAVKRAARKAIDDAGAGGGFILSTGDQCGRDTPEANIRALVEVSRTYGVYS